VSKSKRRRREAGLLQLQLWVARHKLSGQVELRLDGRAITLEANQAAIDQAMQLAGCYVAVTDVVKQRMPAQAVHDNYMNLQKVERDFRLMRTGLLDARLVFVRKESRTRGHVFCCLLALKLSREIERRLHAVFGNTDTGMHAVTAGDALTALSRLCLLNYQIDGKRSATCLPTPDPRQQEILAALQVSLPKK
jgi:transposase